MEQTKKYSYPNNIEQEGWTFVGSPTLGSYTQVAKAPLFKYTFKVNSKEPLRIVLGCTGFYELFYNGKNVTKGYLSPGISNPDQIVFFDSYEFPQEQCLIGENTLEVLLGNGFANPIGGSIWGHTKGTRLPAFTMHAFVNGASFTESDMMYRETGLLFNDLRAGCYYDAQQESFVWNKPFTLPTPPGRFCLNIAEPIREIREVFPASISAGALRDYRIRDSYLDKLYHGETLLGTAPQTGGYIVDLGANYVGVPKLRMKGHAGQRIDFQLSEILFEGFVDYINCDVYPDGCCQHDVLVLKDEEETTWIPPFTYHGGRYVYIAGASLSDIQNGFSFLVLHNDVQRKTSFHSSNETLNALFDMGIRSDEGNLLWFPTDCPVREKNGWTGDISISCEHYLYHMRTGNVFRNWLKQVKVAPFDDGTLPMVIPSYLGKDPCPVWDSVLVTLPYRLWQYEGDLETATEFLPLIHQNLTFYKTQVHENGICSLGLGDWLPPDIAPSHYNSPLGFSVTAMLLHESALAKELASHLNSPLQSSFEDLEKFFKSALRTTYVFGNKEAWDSQTTLALGLALHIFEGFEIPLAQETLLAKIHEKQDHFDTGFLGLRVLFDVLCDMGEVDLAMKLILTPSHPSFANMYYRGFTTLPERFTKPGGRIGSYNHHFMGDFTRFLLSRIIGIQVNPRCTTPEDLVIEPHLPACLDFCSGSYTTPTQTVTVTLKRTGDQILVQIDAKDFSHIEVPCKTNQYVISKRSIL